MKKGYSGIPGNLTPLLDTRGRPKYKSGLLWWRTPLFDFRADPKAPCTFTDSKGTEFRPDNHFECDGGSIPPSTRAVPFAHMDPWNFPRAYPLHDGGYQYGGLYMRFKGELDFKFRLMTRQQTDEALEDWLRYDGATWWDRRVILTGVAAGSWTVWNSKKAAKQRAERKRAKIDVYSMAGILTEDNGGRLVFESTLQG